MALLLASASLSTCTSTTLPNMSSRPISQPSLSFLKSVRNGTISLPKDLQQIIDRDGLSVSRAINAPALKMYLEQREAWVTNGGELISLPKDEQAEMMRMLSSVGDDVSRPKPALREAYQVILNAAQQTRQTPSQ